MNTDKTQNNSEDPEVREENRSTIDQLKQWLSENRQALENAGIVVIEGTYRGDGDEGNFEGAFALDIGGIRVDYELPDEIVELIDLLADELATPGYQDGDGGGGDIRLHVQDASITHQAYFLSIERIDDEEDTY